VLDPVPFVDSPDTASPGVCRSCFSKAREPAVWRRFRWRCGLVDYKSPWRARPALPDPENSINAQEIQSPE